MGLSVRYAEIQRRIAGAAQAAGRDPSEITLVAVSKRQPVSLLEELVALGHRDFGENLIQAWRSRLDVAALEPVRWHLIGPLQTNKAKYVARTPPACLHTVDRPALIDALGARLAPEAPLDVLLQINVDREPQKAGCLPEDLDGLVDATCETPGLRFRGLMAIPRPHLAGAPVAAFEAMRSLLDSVTDRVSGVPELSMGMSGDFEEAIGHGGTIVRVGTALFGPRQP